VPRSPKPLALAKRVTLVAFTIVSVAAWGLSGWWRASGRCNVYGLHAYMNLEGGEARAVVYDIPTTSNWEVARRTDVGSALGVGASPPTGVQRVLVEFKRWAWWWHYSEIRGSYPTQTITIPLWPVPGGALIILVIVSSREFVRRRRERRRGLCRSCGYDRRGLSSPEAVCPECGALPVPDSTSSTAAKPSVPDTEPVSSS
jgi:hypothetical protein